MKKLYLLSGKARSGKDTIANIIKDYYESIGKKVVITSFAKYIKMYAKEITGWNGEEATKPRTLLQELGTEIVREKLGKENIYALRMLDDIDIYNYFADVVIIKDVRFLHELETIKNKFNYAKVIRVNRVGFTNELTSTEKVHSSEVALDSYEYFDYVLENDTIDKLKTDVLNIIKEV